MKAIVVTVSEAKAKFSSLLAQVERGRISHITRRGKLVAELRPLGHKQHKPWFGSNEGRIKIADAFDEPVPGFLRYGDKS